MRPRFDIEGAVDATAQNPCAPPPRNDLEDVIVRVPCYEPNSFRLELTGQDLCAHSLFGGTTGSGKTTTLNHVMRDMIRYRADDPDRKMGLVFFDPKADDTRQKVAAWAAEAGRASDVKILDGRGPHYLEMLSPGPRLDAVRDLVARLAEVTSVSYGGENAYWSESRDLMIDAACVIVLMTSGDLGLMDLLGFINDWLLRNGIAPDHVRERISLFGQILEAGKDRLDESARLRMQCIANVAESWSRLDPRTRGILNTCVAHCLRPLLDPAAMGYLDPTGRQPLQLHQVPARGEIVVVSVNAMEHPDLARLVGRLLKTGFYAALQRRSGAHHSGDRLAGLVVDEYPLVASGAEDRYGDIPQLQTLRGKRGFVVAATQGLASIDGKIGRAAREALLLNFNNLFFFNSHEPAIDAFAQTHFGIARESVSTRWVQEERAEDGATATLDRREYRRQSAAHVWACPAGRLATLDTNQAFVSLRGGRKFAEPLWFDPLYFDAADPGPEPAAPADPVQVLRAAWMENSGAAGFQAMATADPRLAKALERDGESSAPDLDGLHDAMIGIMAAAGRFTLHSPDRIDRMLALPRFADDGGAGYSGQLAAALTNGGACPEQIGRRRWPAAWARALLNLLGAGESYPVDLRDFCRIRFIGWHRGLLLVSFANDPGWKDPITSRSPDAQAVVRLQLSLYPNCFRPLKPRDAAMVASILGPDPSPAWREA